MSDVLRARLAEALLAHTGKRHVGSGAIFCTDGPGGLVHATSPTWREWAEHTANALLSLEGVAIVALPEPVGSRWPVDDDDDFTVSTVELVRASNAFAATPRRHPGCKVEWGSVELNLCTRDARALAAALLAAADVAEVATS